jgi:hypothetical protein
MTPRTVVSSSPRSHLLAWQSAIYRLAIDDEERAVGPSLRGVSLTNCPGKGRPLGRFSGVAPLSSCALLSVVLAFGGGLLSSGCFSSQAGRR